MLEAAAKRFNVEFSAESFGLAAHEYLFDSEGIDVLGVFWRMLRRKPEPEVRSFTVGDLHQAISSELKRKSNPLAQKAEARRNDGLS